MDNVKMIALLLSIRIILLLMVIKMQVIEVEERVSVAIIIDFILGHLKY